MMSIIDDHWESDFDIKSTAGKCLEDYENKLKHLHEHVSMLVENLNVQKFNYSGNHTEKSHDDELKTFIERNKQIRHDIDGKLEELSQKKIQYENYKKDQKLLSQEIKETHEAFLMAKKCYKKFLKMYYTVESRSGTKQTIFLQFFTEAKRESENYSVRLSRDTKTGIYQLLELTPRLHIFKELQHQLQCTNDVPGLLCCIRSAFINIRNKK